MSARALLIAAALALLPGAAGAQAIEWRLDHRNQPSILAGVLYEQLIVAAADDSDEEGSRPGAVADLAFGLPLNDEGGELFLGLRAGRGDHENRLVAPHLFYRVYGGAEAWKTFFDAGLLLRIEPLWAVAARIGIGVQYDFHENWGAWLGAGPSIGYGDAVQVGIDAGLGVQFRFGTAG